MAEGRRAAEVVEGFKEFKNLSRCMGAIDGTHIPIINQIEFKENFINRKGYPSYNVQGVVDHTGRFTDAYTGWPGSVHDARVFSNCDLLERIIADPFKMFPNGAFLVGDAAYKLETFMMTPYRDTGFLTRKQKRYNYIQSSTRIVVERTFGIMKSRFKRLKFIDTRDMKHLSGYLIAVCALHNFSIDEGDRLNYEAIDIYSDEVLDEEVNNFVCYGSTSSDAERKRADIANGL